MSAADDEKPPRPGRGLLKRAALGSVLISLFAATAGASAGLLEVDQLITIVKSESAPIPGIEGALDDVDPGKPQTVLVLGSDRRYIDIKQKNPSRSDTMLLVRLDPSKGATAVMSIPRDLKVNIRLRNGSVVTDKINAAYALGGPRLSVQTVRDLLGIKINHVVNVNFGRFKQTDIARDNTKAILRLLKLAFEASKNPIREVHFPGRIGPTYVTVSPTALRRVRDRFLSVRASSPAPPSAAQAAPSKSRGKGRSARRRGPGLAAGPTSAKTEAENFVAQAATKLRYPLLYPRVRLARGSYLYGRPRVYRIADRDHHRYKAYRIVVSTGEIGQYYGIQGMGWTSPPILEDPSDTVRLRGRTFEEFYDGRHLALIALRTKRAVYWVSNTLSRRLTNPQMRGIAASLTRVGSR